MTELGTLGKISFEINKLSPSSFKQQRGEKWVEHPRLSGAPSLQHIGSTLATIDLSFKLHAQLADPEEQRDKLLDAMREAKALSLVIGSGYQGKWVIQSLDEKIEQFEIIQGETRVKAMTLSAKLKEFAGVEPPEESDRAQQFSGFPYTGTLGGLA